MTLEDITKKALGKTRMNLKQDIAVLLSKIEPDLVRTAAKGGSVFIVKLDPSVFTLNAYLKHDHLYLYVLHHALGRLVINAREFGEIGIHWGDKAYALEDELKKSGIEGRCVDLRPVAPSLKDSVKKAKARRAKECK